jgi:hypothetical protein
MGKLHRDALFLLLQAFCYQNNFALFNYLLTAGRSWLGLSNGDISAKKEI